jgi:predicted dinucleotide-binding enzyme
MGGKLGTIFARAGHEVVFSYARSEQKLRRLAREAKGKARAGTPAEASADAHALLLAVHWSRARTRERADRHWPIGSSDSGDEKFHSD